MTDCAKINRGQMGLSGRIEIAEINVSYIIICFNMLLFSLFPLLGKSGWKLTSIAVPLLSLLAILMQLNSKSKHRVELKKYKFSAAFSLFILYSLISVFWSFNYGGAAQRLLDLFSALLVSVSVCIVCTSKAKIIKVLDCYACGVVAISVFCVMVDRDTLMQWSRLGQDVFTNAGQNLIYYTCILTYSIMYLIYRSVTSRSKRAVLFIVTGFLVCCALWTGVRKPLPVIFIFCYCTILLKNRNNFLKIILLTLLCVIACFAAMILAKFYFESFYQRLIGLISDFTSDVGAVAIGGNSYQQRMWLAQTALKAFEEHPITGLGVGQFRYYSIASGGEDLYAHNNYLELLANGGVVGFFLYYLPYVLLIVNSVALLKKPAECKTRLEEDSAIYVVAFIISIMVMEYGQVDYYQSYFIVFLSSLNVLLNSPDQTIR